jgi:hypothetical protein
MRQRPEAFEESGIVGGGVRTTHAGQNLVVGALERDVQVAADLGRLDEGLNEVIAEVPGLNGTEPDSAQQGQPAQFADGPPEGDVPQVATVSPQGDTHEDQLTMPGVEKAPGLM